MAAMRMKGQAEYLLAAALLFLFIAGGQTLLGLRGLGWFYFVAGALLVRAVWPTPRHERQLLRLLEGCDLCAKIDQTVVMPRIVKSEKRNGKATYTLTLPPGLSSKDFEDKNLALSEGLNATVSTKYMDGRIIMDVERGGRSKALLEV